MRPSQVSLNMCTGRVAPWSRTSADPSLNTSRIRRRPATITPSASRPSRAVRVTPKARFESDKSRGRAGEATADRALTHSRQTPPRDRRRGTAAGGRRASHPPSLLRSRASNSGEAHLGRRRRRAVHTPARHRLTHRPHMDRCPAPAASTGAPQTRLLIDAVTRQRVPPSTLDPKTIPPRAGRDPPPQKLTTARS